MLSGGICVRLVGEHSQSLDDLGSCFDGVDLVNTQCPQSDLTIVEVGVAKGATSAHLLRYCPQISRLYDIDIRRPQPPDDKVTHLPKVEFIEGLSTESAERFADKSIDLVFIDADHSREGVRTDLIAWVPKVKPGGVISGHDYGSHTYPAVAEVVDEFFRDHPHAVKLDANKVWWTLK